jgi:peptidoglycan-associated lipoprotein
MLPARSLLLCASTLLALTACAAPQAEQHGAGVTGMAQTPVQPLAQALPAQFEAELGDRIFFDVDRASLSSEAQNRLAAQARWLNAHPEITVLIEGHCDERGTREYNFALGERRGAATRDYLVALGIAPQRLRVVSFGKERPAMVGTGELVWSQNRRAVLVLSAG